MKNAPLIVSGIIFGIIALVHLFRLYDHFPLVIGHTSVPLWVNALAFIVSALLSAWMFLSARKCR